MNAGDKKLLGKLDRARQANRLIEHISQLGRRFFQHQGNVSCFSIAPNGRVWYHDHYSGKAIYTHYSGRWKHFTGGGTLRSLIGGMARFIQTGTPIDLPYYALGPWPGHYCDGDVWGYGWNNMQSIRAAARRLGVCRWKQ